MAQMTAAQIKAIDSKYAPWNDSAAIVADYYALHPQGNATASPSSPAPVSGGTTTASTTKNNMQYGGWYNNPGAGGKNQRYWGTDASGNPIWTDGSEPSAAPKMNNTQDVSSFLNAFQNAGSNAVPPAPTFDELKSQITPSTPAPAPINRVELRQQLMDKYGVGALTDNLNSLRDQQRQLQTQFQVQVDAETGKPVPLSVIGGRISEEQRQNNEKLAVVTNQIASVTDQINSAQSVISTYIQDAGLDYNDAVTKYNTELSSNLQIYSLLRGLRQDELDQKKFNQDVARSNLTMYVNAVTKGNLDYTTLSPDQKLQISNLELQAGLPVGFISSIKKDANADILFTTSNNGVTQVGFRNADGTISVQSYGKDTTKATQAEKSAALISTTTQILDKLKNSYGDVGPADWDRVRSAFLQSGGTTDDFVKNFQSYADTNRGDFIDAYGFANPNKASTTINL